MEPGLRARRYGVGLSLAVLAALVGADLVAGSRLVVIAAFAVAPLLAAALCSTRATALVAALTVLTATGAGWFGQGHGVGTWLVRVAICAVLSALAVALAALRQRGDRRLAQMTRIAAAAQRALLRTVPVGLGDFRFAARYLSATAEALLGGDLYDVAESPHGTRLIVADVRGKGIDAVQAAAGVLGAYRHAAQVEPDLGRVAAALDALVGATGDEEDFVTAVLAEFSADGSLALVNCGHHPPLLLTPTVGPLEPGEAAAPLGLGPAPTLTTHELPPGSRLLFYTDGLVEARDRRGRFFPLAEHLDVLARGDLERCLDALLDRLRLHAGARVQDDLALVLVEYGPVPPPPAGPPAGSGRRLSRPRAGRAPRRWAGRGERRGDGSGRRPAVRTLPREG